MKSGRGSSFTIGARGACSPASKLRRKSRLFVSALVVALLSPAVMAQAAEKLPQQLQGVTVTEKLGRRAELDQVFTNHQGRRVRLAELFNHGKPVILTLNYYRCKMLCNLQLNALTEGLRGLSWTPGEQFRIVTISIDPREGKELASGKRQAHLDALGRGEVEWHFLVGDAAASRAVADSLGFGYRFDKELDQYAHPAVIMVLSADGRISRYLYGIEYRSQDLKFALLDASEGRVGSTLDRVILSCFHYDATLGRYGPYAFGIMRLGGALTAILLAVFLAVLWRRDSSQRQRHQAEESA